MSVSSSPISGRREPAPPARELSIHSSTGSPVSGSNQTPAIASNGTARRSTRAASRAKLVAVQIAVCETEDLAADRVVGRHPSNSLGSRARRRSQYPSARSPSTKPTRRELFHAHPRGVGQPTLGRQTTQISAMESRTVPGHPLGHPAASGPHVSDLAPLLGVAAALIGLADMAPYVRDHPAPIDTAASRSCSRSSSPSG